MQENFCKCCMLLVLMVGCYSEPPARQQETFEGVPVYSPQDPVVAQGPEFKQSQFQVYTLYRPQVQRRDFNGIFDITPDSARIVREYWNMKFIELTRLDYYGDFFVEFYDYMAYLANAYPVATRQKELVLDSLEKSFKSFCEAKGIGEAFGRFQQEQQKIYGQ